MRSDCGQNHSNPVSPDDIPCDHWYSISFQFCPPFSNPRAKAICLDILNFSRLEFLSLLLLSMTIIVSILFFRRKKWKNALLTRRFFIIESCRHCNHTLSGLASDVTWWGRLPCIYLCRYSLPASQKKKKMAKEIIELLLILITKVHWNFSQNDVV